MSASIFIGVYMFDYIWLYVQVYHAFHDEVDTYRTHWWRCTGPCRNRPPYFGYVKRSMNRVPGPKDTWWGQHQATCIGKLMVMCCVANAGSII